MPASSTDDYKALLKRQKEEEKHGFLLEREKKERGLPAFGKPGTGTDGDRRKRDKHSRSCSSSRSRSRSRDRKRDRRRDRKHSRSRSSSSGGSSSSSRETRKKKKHRKKREKKRDRSRDRSRDRGRDRHDRAGRKFTETDVPHEDDSTPLPPAAASTGADALCVHSAALSTSSTTPTEPSKGPGYPVKLIDGVYLGSASVCGSAEGVLTLRKLGVTHIVNATTFAPMPRVPPEAEGTRVAFACTRVPVSDEPSAPLATHFESVASTMHSALESTGIVYLCCLGAADGAARGVGGASVALAMFYLMRHKGTSLKMGLRAVRNAHAGSMPSVWHMQRLMEAEVRMHGLAEPTISAEEYRLHCLRRLDPSEEPDRLADRLRAARQQAVRLVEASR